MQKIYVGNLPWEITQENLKELFSTIVDVKNVDMVKDKGSGKFRGYCFIEVSDAERAIDVFNGREVIGRPMTVRMAIEKINKPKGNLNFFMIANKNNPKVMPPLNVFFNYDDAVTAKNIIEKHSFDKNYGIMCCNGYFTEENYAPMVDSSAISG